MGVGLGMSRDELGSWNAFFVRVDFVKANGENDGGNIDAIMVTIMLESERMFLKDTHLLT